MATAKHRGMCIAGILDRSISVIVVSLPADCCRQALDLLAAAVYEEHKNRAQKRCHPDVDAYEVSRSTVTLMIVAPAIPTPTGRASVVPSSVNPRSAASVRTSTREASRLSATASADRRIWRDIVALNRAVLRQARRDSAPRGLNRAPALGRSRGRCRSVTRPWFSSRSDLSVERRA